MVTLFLANLLGGIVWWLCALILGGVFQLISTFGNFMLKPFDFSTHMFSQMFGGSFLNTIEGIMIGAGISIAILLLLYGLLRVFTGKLSDDVPNPYSLVGRFFVSVFGCYFIIPIITTYIFPFANDFFTTVLNIKINSIGNSFSSVAENLLTGSAGKAFGNITLGETLEHIFSPSKAFGLPGLFAAILFIVFIVAALINLFKLVVENAERYFTINALVLTGPLAVATFVSEKSSVLKSWFSALISNVVTIIMNLIAFKFIMLAFINCFNLWGSKTFGTDPKNDCFISLIAVVAVSKMAQKFDQIVAQILFRINPIQNRSLIMSALGTIGALDKASKSITGKTMRDNIGKSINSLKNATGHLGGRSGGVGGNISAYTAENLNSIIGGSQTTPIPGSFNFMGKSTNEKGVMKTLNGGLASDLGLDAKRAALVPDFQNDKAVIDTSTVVDGLKEMNGNNRITAQQAGSILSQINNNCGAGYGITGVSPNGKITIGGVKTSVNNDGNLVNKASDKLNMANYPNYEQKIANILNGADGAVETWAPTGSDSQIPAHFKELGEKCLFVTDENNGTTYYFKEFEKDSLK